MRLFIALALLFGLSKTLHAQESMDGLLQKYDTHGVPFISVEELKMEQEKYFLLDTRKKKEFNVSHIPGAIWVGERLDEQLLDSLHVEKTAPIVVYCTVGVRSAIYGKQLNNKGFTRINNLYGSIFAWKNAGFSVVDLHGKETEKVHIYSKIWGKYLENGEKIY